MINRKNIFCVVIISIIISFNGFGQTISLNDFEKKQKQSKSDRKEKKKEERRLANEQLKLVRDNQKGITIHVFGSLTGSSSIEPTIDLINADYGTIFHWQDNPTEMWKNKDLLKGYDIRISYTKESFIPLGIYGGFGSANLFLGNVTDNWEIDSLPPNTLIVSPSKSNYFVFGLSKNLSLSSTLYLGYVKFDTVERTDFLQTTNMTEDMGVNIGFSYKLKNIVISIDDIIHFPYYKDSEYRFGNKDGDGFKFGHRLQFGLGFLF